MSEQFWVTAMIFGLLAFVIVCPFLFFLRSEAAASFAFEWGAHVLGSVISLAGPPLAYYFGRRRLLRVEMHNDH